jgi:uncharacterized membrane protein YfcA
MSRMLLMFGATAGGWFGWWLGGHIGLTTAFLLSVVGTALGVYAGRRIVTDWLNQ